MDIMTHIRRFAILLGVVAIFGAGLLFKPLKKGIDLEGGHSLIFKIDMTDSVSPREDQEKMINILKERVDPRGLMNLEWRPVGEDRIEVRMPAGSREARAARQVYDRALEKLRAGNLRPADVELIVSAPADQRGELIISRTDNLQQRDLLTRAAAAYDAMQAQLAELDSQIKALQEQRDALQSAATQPSNEQAAQIDQLDEQIAELQAQRLDARAPYVAAVAEVMGTGVDIAGLTYTLTNFYIPPQIAKQMVKDEVTRRTASLNERLAALDEKYKDSPVVKERIDAVVAAYKDWANVRQQLDDPDDLIRLIRRTGKLEFRMAPATGAKTFGINNVTGLERYYRQIEEEGPEAGRERGDKFAWFRIRDEDAFRGGNYVVWPRDPQTKGERYILLSNEREHAMLRGDWKLANARRSSKDVQPVVQFTFDDRGADIFAGLTGSHIGDYMAILLDDEVFSAPVINSQIHKTGIIEGRFTVQEVDDLVKTLEAGSLPAKLVVPPVSRESIGATLGQANIHRGQQAAFIGLICVVAFMALYYLLGGFIADFALALNVVLVLGGMALFNATFTLPGIAGIILTIGIAVDANVLIFERLREEQARSQSLRMAIKNAYSRAFSAIIDGNITTLLTCVILGWVGTQEVRGFAITLGMGILFSLFTALLVSRWIFELLVDGGLLKNKVLMLKLVGVPKINWMGKRYVFWAISAGMIVLGIASLAVQGRDILGIEFRSGSRAVVRVTDAGMFPGGNVLTDAAVEARIKTAAADLGVAGMTGANVQVNVVKTDTKVDDFLAAYDRDFDGAVTAAEWEALGQPGEAFAAYLKRLDADGDGKLVRAELANLPESRFQITSTEPNATEVRKVIDAALAGLLDVRARLDYRLLEDQPIPALNLRAGSEGIARVGRADADRVLPSFRPVLRNNEGGVLIAFELTNPAEAQTIAAMQERLLYIRSQAGHESLQYAQPDVLGLVTAPDSANKFTAFAVLARPEGEADWNTFAEQQLDVVTEALESESSLESLTNFDAAQTKAASARAIMAIVLSWAVIIGYLAIRFGSPRWGLAAVICLIHDTLIVVGLIAATAWLAPLAQRYLLISAFKIDMAMIAAILTVIGYSVNDTIVIFDRIRENRGRLTTVSPAIINASVNQSMSRTLLTSGTTLIVVLVMYVWGGDGIRGFNFALLAGILFGTYSSMAVAAPLLMGFKKALVMKVAPAAEQAQSEAE